MRNPPDTHHFNQLVWKIAQQIPEGHVSTYGQIASMILPPDGVSPPDYARMGAQWVGRAMNATPPGHDIPWQRVINSQGQISLPPGSPAANEQRALLESEGVVFDSAGRVDFERYGWEGPPTDWLQEHRLLRPRSLKKSGGETGQPRLF